MSRSTRVVAATAAIALVGALPAPAIAAKKVSSTCSKSAQLKKGAGKAAGTTKTSATAAGRKIK